MAASTEEIVVCGAFLFEGFRDYCDNHPGELIEARIGGAIEQAQMLAPWAERVAWETNYYAQGHGNPEHPGVLAYEVWSPLGWWIAVQYEECGWTLNPRLVFTSGQYEAVIYKLRALLDEFHAK